MARGGRSDVWWWVLRQWRLFFVWLLINFAGFFCWIRINVRICCVGGVQIGCVIVFVSSCWGARWCGGREMASRDMGSVSSQPRPIIGFNNVGSRILMSRNDFGFCPRAICHFLDKYFFTRLKFWELLCWFVIVRFLPILFNQPVLHEIFCWNNSGF